MVLDAKDADKYTKDKIERLGNNLVDFMKGAFQGDMFGFGPKNALGIAGSNIKQAAKGLAKVVIGENTHKATAIGGKKNSREI